jgi:hypothetical protein
MDQNAIEGTVRQIERLKARQGQEPPDPETLRSAATFIGQMGAALAAEGLGWPAPETELGGDGAVVFLWHQGQRFLSLMVAADGAGQWVCEPASSTGAVVNLDFNNRMTAGPEEFAREVWARWARGEDPSAA